MTCHACQPAAAATPILIDNRPGLGTIRYRIGTFSAFREAMIERLSRSLPGLTTREDSDYSITFIDLWAAVLDVLTFYQERLANEAFLGTATQRESVARLAALIDYQLRPGVAATTLLAFTVEAGKEIMIHPKNRAQNRPAAGQPPQTFETTQGLWAAAPWNALPVYPEPSPENPLVKGRTELTLDRNLGPAVAAHLAAGQTVLIVNDGTSDPVEHKTIAALDTIEDRVMLRWTLPIQGTSWSTTGTSPSRLFRLGRTFHLFGHDAPAQHMQASATDLGERVIWKLASVAYRYPLAGSFEQLHALDKVATATPVQRAETAHSRYILGRRAAIVGVTVPSELPDGVGQGGGKIAIGPIGSAGGADGVSTGADGQAPTGSVYLCLDSVYPDLPAGMMVLVDDAAAKTIATVVGVDQVQVSFGALSRPVSRLQMSRAIAADDRRGVLIHELVTEIPVWAETYKANGTLGSAVFVPGSIVQNNQGEPGVLVGRTIQRNAYTGGTALYPSGVETGRIVVVGTDGRLPVEARVTGATIVPSGALGTFAHLKLSLARSLQLTGDTAVLLGNIAPASHGESVAGEVLGTGNGGTFQRFALKKRPLTYLPSPTAAGVESTLEIRVNEVRWNEVPSLYGQPGTARIYVTRLQDNGGTVIQFGDGITGATVPTGATVSASYRTGLGLAGRLDAAAISMPVDRPSGLTAVTNPVPATGGADPEHLETARINAPRTVRTFGRAVSLEDLEDLLRTSGGVAKAQAIWLWDGFAHAAHVTVAAQAGVPLPDHDLDLLTATLGAARDPYYRLTLSNFELLAVLLEARLVCDPALVQATVLKDARLTLLDALSFDRMELGQSLPLSRVYAILQAVPGVVAVDVTRFRLKHLPLGIFPLAVMDEIRARSAVRDPCHPGTALPAQLVGIESPAGDVTMTAAIGGRA